MEPSIPDTLGTNMCRDYRGVVNSMVNLYHKAQFGAFVIQESPHFRMFSIEGFHCIIILLEYLEYLYELSDEQKYMYNTY